jgi:hypothetical protein
VKPLPAALTDDPRELAAAMSLLYRAAELTGVAPDDEFTATARKYGNDAAARTLTALTRRSAADKSPAAMYYIEGCDADGFRFVFEDPYKHSEIE